MKDSLFVKKPEVNAIGSNREVIMFDVITHQIEIASFN